MTKKQLQKAKPIIFDTESVRAVLDDRKTAARHVIKPQPSEDSTFISLQDDMAITVIDKNGNERPKEVEGLYAVFNDEGEFPAYKSQYKVGDILYVREAWQEVYETEYDMNAEGCCVNIRTLIVNFDSIPKICSGLSTEYSCSKMPPRNKYYVYKASNVEYSDAKNELRWRSPVIMPKEAARLFLRVTDVRVERLQGIKAYQIEQEGLNRCNISNECVGTCRNCMQEESIYNRFIRFWNSKNPKKDLDKYGWNANPYVWVYEFERVEVEK